MKFLSILKICVKFVFVVVLVVCVEWLLLWYNNSMIVFLLVFVFSLCMKCGLCVRFVLVVYGMCSDLGM